MTEEAEQSIIPITTPVRTFADHEESVLAVAVFPDRRRMLTSGRTLHLWDLKDGHVLKTMEGHHSRVWAVAVSRDGKLIASGDANGGLITWQGDTGKSLTREIVKAHSTYVHTLDFSPDSAVLATASMSWDDTTKLWTTKTWGLQGSPIECSDYVNCVRYSPSGEHLAIATTLHIQIWNTGKRECITKFGHFSKSLTWTPDGTRLLSSGSRDDPTIRGWDPSTWQQVGDPWEGHTDYINAIAVNLTGTLIASASDDHHVRLWRLSDSVRHTIAIFKHSSHVYCITFSTDGKHILSGGDDKKVSEWAVPKDALPEDTAESPDGLHTVIPGQDDMQDTEPDFFWGMHEHPRLSSSQPRQQRPGLLKRLLAVAITPHRSTPPTTLSATPLVTFKARIRHLLTREPAHTDAALPIVPVDVSYAQAKERNAAAGAPGNDDDLVPDEFFDDLPPNSNLQQPSTAAQGDTGEHGSGRLCSCC